MKYRYELADSVDVARQSVAYALAALGLLPGLESAWEKVPFSFVIDWFVNTSHLFSRFKLGGDALIRVYPLEECISVKRKAARYQSFGGQCIRTLERLETKQDYRREVGSNLLMSRLPLFKLPTISQFITGAALGVALGS